MVCIRPAQGDYNLKAQCSELRASLKELNNGHGLGFKMRPGLVLNTRMLGKVLAILATGGSTIVTVLLAVVTVVEDIENEFEAVNAKPL
eukprot:COSAG02_NODE_2165_length_9612_cov_20.785451_3_plen_89_part_00